MSDQKERHPLYYAVMIGLILILLLGVALLVYALQNGTLGPVPLPDRNIA